jgi:hypothetical protein
MGNNVKIEISRDDKGWMVRSGDLYEHGLGSDEALWCVVSLMTGTGRGYLRSPFEHAVWDARYGVGPKLLPAPAKKMICPNCGAYECTKCRQSDWYQEAVRNPAEIVSDSVRG